MKYLYYLCTALAKCARKGHPALAENEKFLTKKY